MEDNTNSAPSSRYIDPFQLDQERDKWLRRLQYVLVIIIRIIVAGIKFLLNIVKAIGKEVLRTFKLIP